FYHGIAESFPYYINSMSFRLQSPLVGVQVVFIWKHILFYSMKIIIPGAGEVGFHLAKLLSYEAQDITLIDTDKEKLSYADNHLDIRVLKGDATSIQVLKDAEVDDSDLVIGVTASETTNLTLCLLAKQLGCKRTMARIS